MKKKIITIKDFKGADIAYSLKENFGTSKEPVIRKVNILSVGRQYVTIDSVNKEKYANFDSEYLQEKASFGEAKLLFLSEQDAMDYLEKQEIIRWFLNIRHTKLKECSLETLRKAKNVFEAEETTGF